MSLQGKNLFDPLVLNYPWLGSSVVLAHFDNEDNAKKSASWKRRQRRKRLKLAGPPGLEMNHMRYGASLQQRLANVESMLYDLHSLLLGKSQQNTDSSQSDPKVPESTTEVPKAEVHPESPDEKSQFAIASEHAMATCAEIEMLLSDQVRRGCKPKRYKFKLPIVKVTETAP